jgi:hypothetical protein
VGQAEASSSQQIPKLLLTGVVLLDEKTRPQSLAYTVETSHQLKFEVLEHPPYSLDFTFVDWHLFDPLRETLRGYQCTTGQAMK